MALVKIYRAAYIIDEEEYRRVYFSEWVTAAAIPHIETAISELGGCKQNGSTYTTTPVIVGWEEIELDTEPV